MVMLVDKTNLGFKVRRWVGRWLEVILGEDDCLEG